MHRTLGVIVEHAEYLAPGETTEELRTAWASSEESFELLVLAVLRAGNHPPQSPVQPPDLDIEELSENGLLGSTGSAKLSLLRKLKETFYRYFNSLPRTAANQQRAGEAGADYLEYAATVASSIPGYDKVEEFLLFVKQLMSLRAKQGDVGA